MKKQLNRFKFIWFMALLFAVAVTLAYVGVEFPSPYPIIILCMGIMADYLTTYLCFRVGAREGNPVFAKVFRRFGFLGTIALSTVIWALIILLRIVHQTELIQTAVALTYWLVPLNNMVVFQRLQKRKEIQVIT